MYLRTCFALVNIRVLRVFFHKGLVILRTCRFFNFRFSRLSLDVVEFLFTLLCVFQLFKRFTLQDVIFGIIVFLFISSPVKFELMIFSIFEFRFSVCVVHLCKQIWTKGPFSFHFISLDRWSIHFMPKNSFQDFISIRTYEFSVSFPVLPQTQINVQRTQLC